MKNPKDISLELAQTLFIGLYETNSGRMFLLCMASILVAAALW
jgi:hypothetical protein